jgi:hypothetical protein
MNDRDAVQHLRVLVVAVRAFMRCAEKEGLKRCHILSADTHVSSLRSSAAAAEKHLAELERLS